MCLGSPTWEGPTTGALPKTLKVAHPETEDQILLRALSIQRFLLGLSL